MDPNVAALLSGVAGALGMLLLVLLALVLWAWPLLRSVVRFAGNFQTVRLVRHDNGIAFDGKVDDWREPAPLRRRPTNGAGRLPGEPIAEDTVLDYREP